MSIKETGIIKKKRCLSKTEHSDVEKNIISEIADELGIRELTASLMYDRGVRTKEEATEFVGNDFRGFHDPFLLKDMDKVADKIVTAVKNDCKIVVYGDYDVDGVTSVSVLVTYLRRRGKAETGFYIPSRDTEGYGLNKGSVEKLKNEGYGLMITVDTGITAIDEIEYATEIGLDTVVTDHHECMCDASGNNILPCVPCVNPRRRECSYPFDELAGVGVVFKVITAVEMKLTGMNVYDASAGLISEFGELVAVGTVADVMPLYGENRTIVKFGLELIKDPKFIGMRELITLAAGYDFSQKNKKKISTSLISYTLAPRINAVGRMGDAKDAVSLFLSDDISDAYSRAYELCETNLLRQKEESEMLKTAIAKMENGDYGERVIVLDEDNWHHGVIGIVASRITEKYGLPSILISFEAENGEEKKDTDIGKGSCRSIKGLDLVEALGNSKDLLVKYGGHELAAGLTVERGKLQAFRERINEFAKNTVGEDGSVIEIVADAEVNIRELDEAIVNELYLLEPYGQANPVPQFLISDLKIVGKYPLKEGKYTKLILSDGKYSMTALAFGVSYSEFAFEAGEYIDVLGTVELNEYMGKTSVQLHLKEYRRSEKKLEKQLADADAYYNSLHGGTFPAEMLPGREDFAAVYRYLKSSAEENCEYNYSYMCSHITRNESFPYIKLRAVLDILAEMSLITYRITDKENCQITVNKQAGKVDLMSSELLSALKNKAK